MNQITSDSVVESCRSKEDAISILKDENLFKNLTFNEFIKIICWIPEVVEGVLEKEEMVVKLTPEQLTVLGSHSEQNIKAVIGVISKAYVDAKIFLPDIVTIINLMSAYNPELFTKHIPWNISDLTPIFYFSTLVQNRN